MSEIVIASNCKPNSPANHWLVLADGTFNVAKITTAARRTAALPLLSGVNLATHAASSSSQLATASRFWTPTAALAGDIASVQAAIDRKQQRSHRRHVPSKAQQVSANNDFWFVRWCRCPILPEPFPIPT